MKLSNDEKTLALAITAKTLVLVIGGMPFEQASIAVAELEEYFDRPCKLRRALRSLELAQALTFDPYQARVRVLLSPVLRALSCGSSAAQPEMFPAERPLDAALAAACGAPGTPAAPPNPPDAPRVPEHAPCVPAHAPRVPAHKTKAPRINVRTFNRSNVSTLKRNVSESDLRGHVREFVGGRDYFAFWEKENFWTDAGRLEILDRSLRYIQSGLISGEVQTRKTPGAHLWSQFQIDCRAHGLTARV